MGSLQRLLLANEAVDLAIIKQKEKNVQESSVKKQRSGRLNMESDKKNQTKPTAILKMQLDSTDKKPSTELEEEKEQQVSAFEARKSLVLLKNKLERQK